MPKPFESPIYVTRPILPSIQSYTSKLEEVWKTKWLSNGGEQHKNLEIKIKEYLKVPQLSLFNNGTIALMVAIQSLRLSGEVITTPFTFPSTPHVLTWNRIKPIFCDIDPITLNLDENKIESMITPETTGILGVHVFGMPCNVDKIKDIADRYGLKVVYDAAHAFGTEINNKGIGNYGDITMFSFHPTKLFHTAEGGALSFNNNYLKQQIDLLKNFGIKNEEEVTMPGINGKMNELQAVMGLLLIDLIDEEREKRKKIKNRYIQNLKNMEGITFQSQIQDVKSSEQYFYIRIDHSKFGKSRDYVYNEFKKYNVFTRKYFYPLCSDYSCYKHLPSSNPENLIIANKVIKETLTLPFYGELEIDEIDKICEIISIIKAKV